jgi:hypothetical protein
VGKPCALLLISLCACGDAVFQCMDDAQCDGGFCEGTGYCSFEDPACDSGRRYGELAGEGLGGVCVEVDSGTSTSTSTSTSTITSTFTSTSTSTSTSTTLDDASSGSDAVTTTPITSGTVDDSSSTGAPAETTGEPPLEVTVSFGDRSDADFQDVVEDTSLLNYSIENNLGAHRDLHLDGNDFGSWQVALIRFDVSALPDDATILAVTMVMWTFETFDPGEIGVHALTEAWVEGTGDEEPGICNWTLRDQDTPWTTEGAGEGSYDPTELATFSFDRPQADYYIDLSPDLITAWRDDPSTNFGLLLHTIDVAAPLYIPSSEAMDEELRPMLLVTYAP